MSANRPEQRFLGITVLGDFILSEGVDAVIENLLRAGATAVACNPTVTAAADESTGSFQPPTDAGSSPRVFDRPLFGKTSLWVRSGPSYRPNAEFYHDSPYRPREPNDLTDAHGDVVGRFIDATLDKGLKVYFQLGAAQPSGLRDDDRPRLPSGEIPRDRMADTASLASDAVRAYNRSYVRDLLAKYPDVTGFRPDWPEYPCYTLGEAFQDFGPHVEQWCADRDFDFAALKSDMTNAWDHLHGELTSAQIEFVAARDFDSLESSLMHEQAAVGEWMRLKAALSTDLLTHWREIITEAGGPEKELSANAFMPPYSRLTGFDFHTAGEVCDAVSPKLYTMHWSQMVEFWGRELLDANPGVDETTLVHALVNLMEIAGPEDRGDSLADYGYPAPDEPHPIPEGPQRDKITEVKNALDGNAELTPLVHGYGPPEDFRRRLELVADSPAEGVWINRYGYLGKEKLDAIAAF